MEKDTQAWAIEPSTIGANGAPFWYYIIGSENQIVATTWSGSEKQLEHARLFRAAPEMFAALKLCAEQFRAYERHHLVNGDDFKAQRNRDFAVRAEAIIAKVEGGAQ